MEETILYSHRFTQSDFYLIVTYHDLTVTYHIVVRLKIDLY